MQTGTYGVDWVLVTMGNKIRIRMSCQHIRYFCLSPDAPIALRGKAVHAGYNRFNRIFGLYCIGNGGSPIPGCFLGRNFSHTVALITKVPGDDGRMIFESGYEIFNKTYLPLKS
jgi:hypothetical protein